MLAVSRRLLGGVIQRVEAGISAEETRRRARLVTVLIDGASMQVSRGGPAAFLDGVVETAWCLASGDGAGAGGA